MLVPIGPGTYCQPSYIDSTILKSRLLNVVQPGCNPGFQFPWPAMRMCTKWLLNTYPEIQNFAQQLCG